MPTPPTDLDGPVLLTPAAHGDDRGFFLETYRADGWGDQGVADTFVQDNHSRSTHGVLRGMHFQLGAGQAKLVRAATGAIWDVGVDLRRASPTYGRWQAFELSDSNHQQVYWPAAFAHGFCVLSDSADVIYKCSSYYEPQLEGGIAWDDPDVGIGWPEGVEFSVSERDASAPRLADVAGELDF